MRHEIRNHGYPPFFQFHRLELEDSDTQDGAGILENEFAEPELKRPTQGGNQNGGEGEAGNVSQSGQPDLLDGPSNAQVAAMSRKDRRSEQIKTETTGKVATSHNPGCRTSWMARVLSKVHAAEGHVLNLRQKRRRKNQKRTNCQIVRNTSNKKAPKKIL